ncbi:hypothetical protein H1D32_18095 [Anaerobacillus sp. CMMVII]|uniref:hypothetical protein n=1 Tax=Anaerobacillus sp. CMMVII TaxID=2755588 RepID=UPI0021B7D7A3|nr:hypothetical protein [Anaerobacillus sp. CMMVII]MCT8139447.1 hypothetical protein [Anaerobacillus sp. CMMVII]
MIELVFISSIVLFLATIVISNRHFYYVAMKHTAKHFEKKFGFSIEKMSFSFEHMVYLVKLPSNSPLFKNVNIEQIEINYDHTSYMFPNLKGISVNLIVDKDKVTLAYLTIDNYRSPLLDKLLKEGRIDSETYRKISTCKIIQSKTQETIIKEVFRKIQVGRYNIIK